jgi:ribosome-binding factor A
MSRRTAKVAEAVREVVATTILFGLKDPRVKNVTVLWCDAAPDLRSVKVFISVRGEPRHAVLAMHGLESARGFIQRQIADQLELRWTPVLEFVLDPGAKLAAETSAVLREAMAQTEQTSGTAAQAPADQETGVAEDPADGTDGDTGASDAGAADMGEGAPLQDESRPRGEGVADEPPPGTQPPVVHR